MSNSQLPTPPIVERITKLYLGAILLGMPIIFYPFIESAFESVKLGWLRLTSGLFIISLGFIFLTKPSLNDQSRSDRYGFLRLPPDAKRPLFLFLFAYILSIVFSVNKSQSILGNTDTLLNVTTLISWTILFVVAFYFFSHKEREDFFYRTSIIISLPITVYGLIQYFDLDLIEWQTDSASIVLSTLGRSIYLGEYLAVLLIITAVYMLKKREEWGKIGLILILQLICFSVTIARGAWIGLISGLAIGILPFFPLQRPIVRAGLITSLVLTGVIGFWLFQTGLPNSAVFLTDANAQEFLYNKRTGSNQVRIEIWQDSIRLILKSPVRFVVGYGPDSYEQIFYSELDSEERVFQQNYRVTDPHNILFKLWLDLGLIGLLSIAWLLFNCYRRLFFQIRQADSVKDQIGIGGLLGAFTALLIPKLFNPLISVQLMFLIFFFAFIFSLEQKTSP